VTNLTVMNQAHRTDAMEHRWTG